jgi:hypothetical protein
VQVDLVDLDLPALQMLAVEWHGQFAAHGAEILRFGRTLNPDNARRGCSEQAVLFESN